MIRGDGLDGMRSLDPGSVDMVLADLPSGETNARFARRSGAQMRIGEQS